MIGTWPSSSRTPIFVVVLCTPSMVLSIICWQFATGLFVGVLSHPQKSLAYNKIGFTTISINFSVSATLRSNESPSEDFSLKNAFTDLSFRSVRPVFNSPEGDYESEIFISADRLKFVSVEGEAFSNKSTILIENHALCFVRVKG